MKNKKNPKIVSEKLKTSHTLMGLNIVIAIILASFSYGVTTEVPNKNKSIDYSSTIFIAEEKPKETVQQQSQQKPKPKKEKVIDLTQEVKIEENVEEDCEDEIVEESDVVEEGDSTLITSNNTSVLPIDEATDFPDIEASFPGGPAAMMKWINDYVKYPQTSIEMNEQGRVFLSFVVEKDGSITNVKVERSISPDLDKEAKRIIQNMPNWTPGKITGTAVRVRCRLPINFQLQ